MLDRHLALNSWNSRMVAIELFGLFQTSLQIDLRTYKVMQANITKTNSCILQRKLCSANVTSKVANNGDKAVIIGTQVWAHRTKVTQQQPTTAAIVL
ncbi:hypothetical protein J6590_071739 [Homalodisca vitripennis]|nr:hypothetical protein J6590_071739 [Homalodisca vitripennis]